MIATTEPATLPEATTWYLVTNLPAPGVASASSHAPAKVTDVVRLYGLRQWIEQSYKQVKQSLGWAQHQVRSNLAIRRHWQLVCGAFSFCWWAEARFSEPIWELPGAATQPESEAPWQGGDDLSRKREKKSCHGGFRWRTPQLASGFAPCESLVGAGSDAVALLAGLVGQAAAARFTTAPQLALAGTGH